MPNVTEPPCEPLLAEQGVYLAPGRANWQIGQLLLYPDRLVFEQPRKVIFDMPLAWLLDVAIERKHYVLVRKPTVAVTFQDPRLRNPATAWFLTPLLGQWLAQLTALLPGELGEPGEPGELREERWERGERTPFSGSSSGGSSSGRSGTSHAVPHAAPALPLGTVRTGTPRAGTGGRASQGGGPSLSLGSLKGGGGSPASQPGGQPGGQPAGHPGSYSGSYTGSYSGGSTPGAAGGQAMGSSRPVPAAEGRVLRPLVGHPHTGSQAAFSPQALARLAAQLDPTSRALLAHLVEVSHANIRELSEVIGASSDMAVLFCIRHTINPTAKALLGRPVLSFVEAQLDQVTGEMVPFAWWLVGRRGRMPLAHPAPYEVHDEGATIVVLLELEGVEPNSIRCTAGDRRLAVTAQGPAQQWHNEIDLPAPVAPKVQGQRLNNGILSIALAKEPQEEQ